MHIDLYKKDNGEVPVEKFLRSLNRKLEAKTVRTIDLLEEFGIELREPNSKPLGDGIFGLRATLGSDTTRVLYFFYYQDIAVLTHGFVKKTRKTPPSEIKKAKEYRDDYLRRKGKDSK